MKKMMMIVAAVALAMVAGQVHAAVDGSAHDFIDGTGAVTGATVGLCATCHVPHKPLQNVPLWAHALSAQTFNLYNTNATYTGGNDAAYQDDGGGAGVLVDFTGTGSAACLSCHDGTIVAAAGYTLSMADATWIMYDEGAIAAGPNGLKGSHPIGVDYTVVQAADTAGYTDNTLWPGTEVVKLENNMVQCNSCHNPHNAAGTTKMLVKDNANSEICTTCHIK